MNRFGWLLLLLFLAAAIILGMMVRFGRGTPQAAPSPSVQPAQGSANLVIPVANVTASELTDTWGQSRADGAREHHAIDIMAPRGTLVVAAAPGRVEKVFESNDGGHTIYVRSPDQHTVYYYAHLDTYREGLVEGQAVRPGDVIGTVGSTGNASPGAPHLHFEIKQMGGGERWYQGREVNPYPLLAGKASAS